MCGGHHVVGVGFVLQRRDHGGGEGEGHQLPYRSRTEHPRLEYDTGCFGEKWHVCDDFQEGWHAAIP